MTTENTTIQNIFKNDKLVFYTGLMVIIIYLIPLFLSPLYISIFDILDSTVPSLKILAHSGKIFANNNDIIPNMMSGLPRSTYGSEYSVMLWLYYFFDPKTAYIINQITIHIVAYLSMYIFLKKYIVSKRIQYSNLLVLAGSLYFALLPIFSSEGLTIPMLPLVTYSLLNIKNNSDNKWDWILLIFLPLYANFVFLYIFYIVMAGIYLLWDSTINKHINWKFFFALVLMGMLFLLKEYRLVFDTLFDPGFISHRVEFHKFFIDDLLDAFRRGHTFFLIGHHQHLIDMQMPYILPIIIISMFLSVINRKLNKNESMLVWLLIVISFALNIWSPMLTQLNSMPLLTIYTLLIYLFTKDTRTFPLLFLLQIVLALFMFLSFCNCNESLTVHFPILKSFNISRLTFIQPFIWGILLVLSFKTYLKHLHYSIWFIILFIGIQSIHEFNIKEFYNKYIPGYETFQNYYAPKLFDELKKSLPERKNTIHVVSFGLEPAVSLYNELYTVDGYTTNYPLKYKEKFHEVIKKFLSTLSKHNNYDEWGSKVYLMGVPSMKALYQKGIVVQKIPFSVQALCTLRTNYLISAYKINTQKTPNLFLKKSFKGDKNSWDIYLYKIKCKMK